MNIHYPVLLQEALAALDIISTGIYIDATFGQGGHSRKILGTLGPEGLLFTIDQDPQAQHYITEQEQQDTRFQFCNGSFSNLTQYANQWNITGKVNGILLDLGTSSTQLETPHRGFSFLKEGFLDMRMNPTIGISAFTWLRQASKTEMVQIFKSYGEERWSKRIAHAIYEAKQIAPIETTTQLASIIKQAHPRWPRRIHPATRVFQAIRIHTNHELTELKQGLEKSLEILAPGGKLVIITFHSLEARIVKDFVRQTSNALPRLQWVTKSMKPSQQEILHNPRSRSAILRVLEKKL